MELTLGVLALQGAFQEHSAILLRLEGVKEVLEVRLPRDFAGLDALVLPGGESTAMGLIGEGSGVFAELKKWVQDGRPVWGTCAGMILLSDTAIMQKRGGQSLVGGLQVEICRNYFGSQVSSFEQPVCMEKVGSLLGGGGGREGADTKGSSSSSVPYPAVFIRAPAILEVGDGVEVLASVQAWPCSKASRGLQRERDALGEEGGEGVEGGTVAAKRDKLSMYLKEGGGADGHQEQQEAPRVTVAARKGSILVTAFHPELTNDVRWHQVFLSIARAWKAEEGRESLASAAAAAAAVKETAGEEERHRAPTTMQRVASP